MEKVFLGNSATLSKLVSDFIIKNYTKNNVLNLKDVSLVVSGASVYRRILEQILKDTEKDGIFFVPPQTHTIKSIIDLITLQKDKLLIDDFLSELYFVKALKNKNDIVKEAFFKVDNVNEKENNYINLAQKIRSLYVEIGKTNLSFEDVAQKIKKLDLYDDSQRWETLSEIYEEYKNLLLENNLVDSFIQRQEFINSNNSKFKFIQNGKEGEIIFINTPDLNPVFCDIINKIESKVTFLIYSLSENKEFFSDLGTLNVKKWLNKKIKIDDEKIVVAKDPRYAADVIGNKIVGFSKDYSATDIVVCTTDDSLILLIKNECQSRGIKISALRENHISNSFLYDIFENLKNYIKNPSFLNFKKFVCQDNILSYILSHIGKVDGETINKKDILNAFDNYENEHFPFYLTKTLCTNKQDKLIEACYKNIKDFFEDRKTSESLKYFSKKILNLILKIFENTKLSHENDKDRVFIQVFEAYKNTLFKISNIDESALGLSFSYEDFLTILNNLCENISVTPKPEDDTVEIQGWLEVQADNSKVLILTGLYEGSWPQNIVSHEFLPNSLRTLLGIDDDDKRFARDIFILETLLNSKEQILFVPLRQNADLSSNLLSKLLLLDDERIKAKRVLKFYDSALKEFDLGFNSKKEDLSFYSVPQISSYKKDKFSPTEIKTYHLSPYGYYLQYVLNLSSVEIGEKEFSALIFGNVVHDLLKDFGTSNIKDSMQESEIKDYLLKRLNEFVFTNLGNEFYPAINIQLEKIKEIIEVFSLWQAQRRRSGWEILYIEKPFKDVFLDIEDEHGNVSDRVLITGRYDRVDYNKEQNLYNILDYKTGSSKFDIEKVYKPKNGWEDWQMPFYLYALSFEFDRKQILTSYLNLSISQDPTEIESPVSIDDDKLFAALSSAKEIIKNIKNAQFKEIGKIEYINSAFLDLI